VSLRNNEIRARRAQEPVTVTGIGAVSGYGWGERRLREGLYSGRSAVHPVSGFLPWAPRRELWLAPVEPDEDKNPVSREGRALRFAAREALSDAQARGWKPGENVGIVQAADEPHHLWVELSEELQLHGPGLSMTAGAASAAVALLTAKCWIEAGVTDDVLVVCSDLSLSPDRLRERARLSPIVDSSPGETCRPFQQGSTGANPGEAVVALVVSTFQGSPYARVLGGAMANGRAGDDVDALQLRRAFDRALSAAGVSPADVIYVNANGTGAPAVDAVEAAVVDELLGSVEGMYSLKPLLGDCGAAAGAVELIGALYGFSTGVVPAPARLAAGHPRLLDGPTAATDGVVAKDSIGSSGECAVVLVGSPAA
jgi:3-oxoacyl-[acyl-carrier-protein] synthase II